MLGQIIVLKDVADRLEQAGIAYMITGSLAMNYYAQPRMTRDVRNLLASVPEIDEEYLGEWAGKLGLAELLQDARP